MLWVQVRNSCSRLFFCRAGGKTGRDLPSDSRNVLGIHHHTFCKSDGKSQPVFPPHSKKPNDCTNFQLGPATYWQLHFCDIAARVRALLSTGEKISVFRHSNIKLLRQGIFLASFFDLKKKNRRQDFWDNTRTICLNVLSVFAHLYCLPSYLNILTGDKNCVYGCLACLPGSTDCIQLSRISLAVQTAYLISQTSSSSHLRYLVILTLCLLVQNLLDHLYYLVWLTKLSCLIAQTYTKYKRQ